MTNLADRHLKEWRESGVDDDIIERNAWTIEDPSEVDRLLNRNESTRWKHSTNLVPGWAVAGIDPISGERTFKGAQFKPDTPPETKAGKPLKYLSASNQAVAPLFLEMVNLDFWLNVKNDVHREIAIVEGAKKAGALLSAGEVAISIPGVSTGGKLGRLRPELAQFCQLGRVIRIYFDRDLIHKPQVRKALINLGRMLKAKGASVFVCVWPNEFKGIDDYLATGAPLRPVRDSAFTVEEWIDETKDEYEDSEVEQCTLAKRFDRVRQQIGDRLRWNNLKGRIELDDEPVDLQNLRLRLAIAHNIQLPQDDCKAVCLFLAQQRRYSPVVEYLEDCAVTYPADEQLLDTLAPLYLGADSDLYRAYLRKTLIAAVARAVNPGCKVDTVCILTGPTYAGKSTFWKILASEEWFDDSLGNVSDKDERLKLHAAWFVEWAELEVIFRRKDVSAAKAFITTQIDAIRPPYGAEIIEMPRPSIFVGTTNETDFLSDPTGNRRYWVVPLGIESIPIGELIKNRDRIWAAAYHAYKSGEHWTLSRELYLQAQEETANYLSSDPWESLILDYVADQQAVTTSEILIQAIKLDFGQMGKREEMRVANLLKAEGWSQVRRSVHGKKRRVWINPKFSDLGRSGRYQDTETDTAVGGQPSDRPSDRPSDQPPEAVEQMIQIGGLDFEVTDLTDPALPFPKSSGTKDASQSNPLTNSIPGLIADPDCEVEADGGWYPARLIGENPNLRVCGCAPGLHVFNRVSVDFGGDRLEKAIVCADCSYRSLGGGSHAHES